MFITLGNLVLVNSPNNKYLPIFVVPLKTRRAAGTHLMRIFPMALSFGDLVYPSHSKIPCPAKRAKIKSEALH